MKCEILRNGKVIAGAMEFDVAAVKRIIAKHGANPDLVPISFSKLVEIATIKIKPVRDVKPATTLITALGAPARSETETEVVYTYGIRERSLEEVQALLKARVATIHEEYEKGYFEYQGAWLRFDLEARINAMGAVKAFEAGSVTEGAWRGKNKTGENTFDGVARVFMTSVDDARGIEAAITAAVNRGFYAKELVELQIVEGTLETLVSFNAQATFNGIIAAAVAATAES